MRPRTIREDLAWYAGLWAGWLFLQLTGLPWWVPTLVLAPLGIGRWLRRRAAPVECVDEP